jgi:hypothetical protein
MWGRSHFKRRTRPAEWLARLRPGPGPAGPPEKLSRIHFQDRGEVLDNFEPRVSYGPLDPGEVCPIHLGIDMKTTVRSIRSLAAWSSPPERNAPATAAVDTCPQDSCGRAALMERS